MPILHLVTRSPGQSAALRNCLERLGEEDSVVLLAAGLEGLATAEWHRLCQRSLEMRARLYVLRAELSLLNKKDDFYVEERRLMGYSFLDYSGLVALTLEHRLILTWS